MPYTPQPFVEQPNLRAPIALIVDDPTPCINPLWYFRHQVDGQSDPAHEKTIPLDFMEAWCDWVRHSGVRGDFSVIPYPAGLGRIDGRLDGCDDGEVQAWVTLARAAVAPQFDIHPEILTHTRALDLATGRVLPVSEHEWMASQDEGTLTEYFAAALQILRDAGLPAHGLTQPCFFHGDEAMYARALLAAEKRVNGRRVTHNFLHVDAVASLVPPRITHLDTEAGEAVVSVWAATDDYFWSVQERGHPEQGMSPETLADRHVTADGTGGRLADILAGSGPLVLVTHWQSLYANGSRLGLRALREVVARVSTLWSDRVSWRTLSEISRHFLATQTAQFGKEATPDTVNITVTSPFATDIFTFSVPMPWPLSQAPAVWVDGWRAAQAPDAAALSVGKWLMRGSVVTVSLALEANRAATVRVERLPAP